jgi:hypothetical protein
LVVYHVRLNVLDADFHAQLRDRSSTASTSSGKRKRAPSPEPGSKKAKQVPSGLDVDALAKAAKGQRDSSGLHTPKVAEQLYAHHNQLLLRHSNSRRILTDQTLSPCQRVNALVAWASNEEQVEPPREDPRLGELVALVAPMLCQLAAAPNRFDPAMYEEILEPASEDSLATIGEQNQVFYIRFYERSREEARSEFVSYLNQQPIDAAYATASMAVLGMADTANETLPQVLRVCGFEGAEFEVQDADDPMTDPVVKTFYGGTSVKTPAERQGQDEAAKPQSRLTHYLKQADRRKIRVFEIRPWRIPINDPLEWRRRALLQDLERILVFCLPLSLNSALGGFIPRYRPPAHIAAACEQVASSLPPPVDGVPDAELSSKLDSLIDKEAEFFNKMRADNHPVGPKISDAAFRAVKENLSGFLRTINGFVVCLWLLRDITRETFVGAIKPGFFPDDMGRSMAILWDSFEEIHRYNGFDTDPSLRSRLGSFLDVWRLIIVHRYWGLMIVTLIILLEQLDPLLIIGFSAPVSYIFLNSILLDIATDTKLDGRLKQKILDHPRIKSLMSPPTFRDFQDFVGKLQIVSTGSEPHQLSLYLPVIHPGRNFYRPWVLSHLLQVGFLVTFKGIVAQRVLAHLVRRHHPEKTPTVEELFFCEPRQKSRSGWKRRVWKHC